MKKAALLMFSILLTGCMTPQQMAERNALIARQQQEQAETMEMQKQNYCARIGAPKGSPNYYDCRMRLDQQLATEAIIQQQQQNEALSELQQANRTPPLTVAPLQVQPNSQVHCSSYAAGPYVNTNCY